MRQFQTLRAVFMYRTASNTLETKVIPIDGWSKTAITRDARQVAKAHGWRLVEVRP